MTGTTHSARSYRLSLLLYAAVAIVAFFPVIAMDNLYFANDLLALNYPMRAFLKAQVLSGHFPLWDPFLLGGQPFFADPNASMCYPLNYLTTLFFPVPYGLGVYLLLHMFIAAVGMHAWLKSLHLSENACRVGSLLFALSNFYWWELIHPQGLASYSWFPWWMAALENLSRDRTPRRAFWAGLCLAMVFLCQSFQMTSYFVYAGVFYFLFRLWVPPEHSDPAAARFSWKKLAMVLFFGGWGSLIILTHVLPTYEFSKYSNRRDSSQTYENFNGQFSMRPSSTYEFLFPTLGVPPEKTIETGVQEISDQVNIDNAYLGVFGYMGVWVPFLAFLAFRRKDKRFIHFLLAFSVFCVLVSWGRYFPLHRITCVLMPGMKLSRVPFRIMACYIGFVGILAAYGFQELEKLSMEEDGRKRWPALGALIYALALFLVACAKPQETWREMLALVLGTAGYTLWGLTRSWKTLGKALFLCALVLPLFLTGWTNFGWGPRSNYDVENNFPAVSYLRDHAKEGRFFFDPTSLPYKVEEQGRFYQSYFPEDTVQEFGIHSVTGYNPIQLVYVSDLKTLPLPTYLRLLSIRGFLFGRPVGEIPGFRHQELAGGLQYYETLEPPSPAMAPPNWKVVKSPEERLQLMRFKDFDPQAQVVLSDELPPAVLSRLSGQKADLRCERTVDDADRQAFKVRLDKDSLVVFSEVMFPGWKAKLDGAPADLFTGDHAFRTLFVPAGDHTVEFSFEPAWAKPLLAGSILWFLSAIGFWAFTGRRRGAERPTGDQGPAGTAPPHG